MTMSRPRPPLRDAGNRALLTFQTRARVAPSRRRSRDARAIDRESARCIADRIHSRPLPSPASSSSIDGARNTVTTASRRHDDLDEFQLCALSALEHARVGRSNARAIDVRTRANASERAARGSRSRRRGGRVYDRIDVGETGDASEQGDAVYGERARHRGLLSVQPGRFPN